MKGILECIPIYVTAFILSIKLILSYERASSRHKDNAIAQSMTFSHVTPGAHYGHICL